jgi:hypothetical protein
VLELRDVGRRESKTARLRFVVFGESFFEPQLAVVLAALLQSVDEQKVGTGRGKNPSTVCRHVHANDWITQCRDQRLCVDSESVEQADISLLGCDGNVALLRGCGGRESILGNVLLQLVIDELVASETRIDPIESVARKT